MYVISVIFFTVYPYYRVYSTKLCQNFECVVQHWCFLAISALLRIDLSAADMSILGNLDHWAFSFDNSLHVDSISIMFLPTLYNKFLLCYTSKFNHFIMPFRTPKSNCSFVEDGYVFFQPSYNIKRNNSEATRLLQIIYDMAFSIHLLIFSTTPI